MNGVRAMNEIFLPILNNVVPDIQNHYLISNYGRVLNSKLNTFIGSFRNKYNRYKVSINLTNNKIFYADTAILEYCVFNDIQYDKNIKLTNIDGNIMDINLDNLFNLQTLYVDDGVIISNPIISSSNYYIKDKNIMYYPLDEKWTNITEYAVNNILPIYMISNYGRIYNKVFGSIISLQISYNGYIVAILKRKDGSYTNASVHRTMMKSFFPIDNPELFEVDHIDCNSFNNTLSNLRWLTPYENEQHMLQNAENIKFTVDEVNKICKAFDDGLNFMQISCFVLNKKYTGSLHAKLVDIYRGKSFTNISSQYNFRSSTTIQ